MPPRSTPPGNLMLTYEQRLSSVTCRKTEITFRSLRVQLKWGEAGGWVAGLNFSLLAFAFAFEIAALAAHTLNCSC